MKVIILALSLLSLGSTSLEWEYRKISTTISDEAHFCEIRLLSKPSICRGDVVELGLGAIPLITMHYLAVQYALEGDGAFTSPIIDLISSQTPSNHFDNITSESNQASTLNCAHDDTCGLVIDSIIANPNELKLILTFNTDTNQVELSSTYDILRMFHLYPSLYGKNFGEWKSPREVHLTLSEQYVRDLIQAHGDGRFKISIRESLSTSKLLIPFIHFSCAWPIDPKL
jgi:hypothetical protein